MTPAAGGRARTPGCAPGETPYPVVLGRLIRVEIEGATLDFDTAQALAKLLAARAAAEAMLLAWYDRGRGRAAPDVPECQHQPGWLAYAEGHGGDVTVDINRGEYLFLFASGRTSDRR